MIDGKKVIAIIPARGGSKGIIKKNLANLGGYPLIAWSINAAMKSGIIDCIHVSTDDLEIANVSKQLGADVPFLRPECLSTDISKTSEAINFTILQYAKLNMHFDIILELQPTYPFRTNQLIFKCVSNLIEDKIGKSIITIVETKNTSHSNYCVQLTNNLIEFKHLPSDFRRQNLSKEYSYHGIVICTYVTNFLKNTNMCNFNNTIGFIINDEIQAIDINNPIDLFVANQAIKYFNLNLDHI